MHLVAVVALDGVVPFDLATPCEVFERVRLADGRAPYRVQVCGVTRTVDAGTFELKTRHGLRDLLRADTIIVPGVAHGILLTRRARESANVLVTHRLLRPSKPGQVIFRAGRLRVYAAASALLIGL